MSQATTTFNGFEPFDANFINCPNQFLDVCLVARSRGVVRVVGYLIYKTYSWVDSFGVPIKTKFELPWNELVSVAGIGRGSISAVKEEAQRYNLICIDPATKCVSLNFDHEGAPYQKTETTFNGFYTGPGHRTKLPKQFFEFILPREPLKVLKVVGTIFRFTVGFQANSGYRRSQHKLSARFVSKHANLALRHAVAGLEDACNKNYITRVRAGSYTEAAVYAPSWCVDSISRLRSETANLVARVQKGKHDRFEKGNTTPEFKQGNSRVRKGAYLSSKKESLEFEKGNNKKNSSKKSPKQLQSKEDVAVDLIPSIQLLREQGISECKAQEVATVVSFREIQQQINWLPLRSIKSNPQGFLINACLGSYSEPEPARRDRLGVDVAGNEKWHRQDEFTKAKRLDQFRQRRDALLLTWQTQSLEARQRWRNAAAERYADPTIRQSIKLDGLSDNNTHKFILDEMALELGLQTITDNLTATAIRP